MKLVWTWALWSHTTEDNFPLKLFFSWLPFKNFENLHTFWSIDYVKWRCHTFLILRKKSVPYSYLVPLLFSLAAKWRSIHSRVLQFNVHWQKIHFQAHEIGRINGKILAFEFLLYLIYCSVKHSRDSYLWSEEWLDQWKGMLAKET